MNLHQFNNANKVLTSIDHHEVPFLDGPAWQRFSSQPARFLMRADDETAARIWEVVERRSQRRPSIAIAAE
jgi:hypothetical protein